MSLKDRMASDVKDVLLNTEEHAEDVVHTPSGGPPATIPGIVNGVLDPESGHFLQGECTVELASADAPSIAAGDALEVRGRTGSIRRIDPDGFGLIRVHVRLGVTA